MGLLNLFSYITCSNMLKFGSPGMTSHIFLLNQYSVFWLLSFFYEYVLERCTLA